MSRGFNNWSRPRGSRGKQWGGQRQRIVPPGLRGKEIGMYFRGLQVKKQKKEIVINLKIPIMILTSLETNLKAIAKIAARQNISLPQNRKSDSFKNNMQIKDIKTGASDDVNIQNESSSDEYNEEKEQKVGNTSNISCEAGPSTLSDFIPLSQEVENDYGSEPKLCALRLLSNYKYGYNDIITGSFNDKLDECLAKGVSISFVNSDTARLNTAFFDEYEDMIQKTDYKKMLTFREKLPTYTKAKDVLNIIQNNQVVVISGETGCGKSTQVPQLILDEAICAKRGANVKIMVTQPRRIAASSLAIRVAKERGESLGNSVGYAVRLERAEERARGSIQYCTTGILLAELEVNQGLSGYSHIILDEVHERDVHVDLSMCMLKQVLKKRQDLKLILMSATIDAESLSGYFDNCPLMHIEGLAYPVRDVYLEDILGFTKFRLPPEKVKQTNPKWKQYRNRQCDQMEKDINYKAEIAQWLESKKKDLSYDVYKTLQDSRIEELNLELVVELLIYICKGKEGAILVFLPGIAQITSLMKLMDESKCFPRSCYEIYPLHSKLPTLEQHKIFEKPRGNIRKIIIATNIAETSITIDDIVYVVDCGKIKIKGLHIDQNITTLNTEWVSQANLRQRRGRAGRCQPGICYHLITTFRAQNIPERLLPELQRSNLLEPVLMIKKLRLGLAVEALKLVPSPPAETTVNWAVKHLQSCGALDDNETLTPLGWHLARLPVHPAAGKLLLFGALFGCLDRAASIAAVWGFKDPFMLVIGKEREVDIVKRNMSLGEPSDHIAISEAILEWENRPHSSRRSFAYDNYLSNNTLQLLYDMKKQLGNDLRQMGFLPSGNIRSSWENRNAQNLSLFKAIVAASLYPNIAQVKWSNSRNIRKVPRFKAFSPEDGKLSIHPSSVMAGVRGGAPMTLCNNPGANWLVYWLKQRTSDLFLLDVTLIYTLPLLFFGEFAVDTVDPEYCLIAISTTKVRCQRESASKLFELRSLLDNVLASKITDTNTHSIHNSEFENQILNTVIQLITAEDEQMEYLSDEIPDSDRESETEDKW
ncbi:ATP-dependent DNA/RNA helicase DHX36-like [Nymphalis io]|uniref:ATP-dependent DNA/RNA helicase DHX36-like n=1 Tax=Inachis io TaxID=171585 RepID=UPI002168670F|nr:ATP-dependent DNA/RNA helicase DHX36-like [Nymphalis io]